MFSYVSLDTFEEDSASLRSLVRLVRSLSGFSGRLRFARI